MKHISLIELVSTINECCTIKSPTAEAGKNTLIIIFLSLFSITQTSISLSNHQFAFSLVHQIDSIIISLFHTRRLRDCNTTLCSFISSWLISARKALVAFIHVSNQFLIRRIAESFFGISSYLIQLDDTRILLIQKILQESMTSTNILSSIQLTDIKFIKRITLISAIFPIYPSTILLQKTTCTK